VGCGDRRTGSAVVSSDAPVSVSQIVTYVDLAGNPLSESAVPALLDPDLALEFRVPVDTTGALNTGVALYNPGTAAEEGSQATSMELNDLLGQWYTDVVEPLMELAQASDDEDVMRCAATVAIGYARQAILMGGDESAEVAVVDDFASYIMQRALQKLLQRCQQHDFTVFYDLISAARQLALTGGDPSAASDAAMSCPPQLELTFTSEISGVIPVGLTGAFDSTIKAKTNLTGSSLRRCSLR